MKTGKVIETHPLSLHDSGISASLSDKSDNNFSRIDSYDIVRALAVLGMIVVNYYVVLLEFSDGHSRIFLMDLGELLVGRAAALFVMLAGIGITLMARSALVSQAADKLSVVRKKIFKRCLILFLMGHLFWLYWHADILHFYGLFLAIGVMLLTLPGKTIWMINILIMAISTWIYWLTGGDPDLNNLFYFHGIILNNLSDLFFSGYYSAFPWLTFLLIGIWFGKRLLVGSTLFLGKIAIGALVMFLLSEKLLSIGDKFYIDPTASLTALLLTREAFPLSPLYVLSAGSGGILVIIVIMGLCRNRLALKLLMPLKNVGRLSLSIYVSHVFMAFAFENYFEPRLSDDDYVSAALIFFIFTCLFYIIFANLWFRYFKYGPLEAILRMASNFGSKRPC